MSRARAVLALFQRARPRTIPQMAAERPLSTSSVLYATRPSPRRPPPRQEAPPVNPLTLRDGDIPYRTVQLVGDSGLGEPQPLRDILSTYSKETHTLKLVALEPPVVKLVNIEEEKQREREHDAKVKLSRRLAVEDKEVQVGWNAAPSDLQHKVTTARHLLEKGDRVHIIFATRAGSSGRPKPTPDARKVEILAEFEAGLEDVGKRWKEDERTKGLWVTYWQPLPSVTAEVKAKVVEGVVDKKRVRDEKKEARRLKEEERLRKAREKQLSGK